MMDVDFDYWQNSFDETTCDDHAISEWPEPSMDEIEEIFSHIDDCKLIKSLRVCHSILVEIAHFAAGHFDGCLSMKQQAKHFQFRRRIQFSDGDQCKACLCDCFALSECVSCHQYYCPKCSVFPEEWSAHFVVCRDFLSESLIECNGCNTQCKLYYAANHELYCLDNDNSQNSVRQMMRCGHTKNVSKFFEIGLTNGNSNISILASLKASNHIFIGLKIQNRGDQGEIERESS